MFLGHDWLVQHNLMINWKTGKIIFARCHCQKMMFVLPNADPTNRWDKELEEGETILAVGFNSAIQIRAQHHANELAAQANVKKAAKMFEEIVLEWCRDFRDLFDKEQFNELPKEKPWDHVIKLIPNVNTNLNCKVYPLNWTEQELDKFLDKNLTSG